jgi:hypothetical protein
VSASDGEQTVSLVFISGAIRIVAIAYELFESDGNIHQHPITMDCPRHGPNLASKHGDCRPKVVPYTPCWIGNIIDIIAPASVIYAVRKGVNVPKPSRSHIIYIRPQQRLAEPEGAI